jgi:hypothetical protein
MPDERNYGLEPDILARHQLYLRATKARRQRWTRSTRHSTPVWSVMLNPPGVTA